MKNESLKTLTIAGILCVVCSVLVSGTAVLLRPEQDANKALDVKKNLLLASGLIRESAGRAEIEDAFTQIQAEVIDLETGEVAEGIDPSTFDAVKAAKDPRTSVRIPSDQDISGIKMRSKLAVVYRYVKNGELDMIVLPVYGKGLWSTMYGFLALSPDARTIRGLGFYAHGETPGLGGEIDNPKWKALWVGKKTYDEEFRVRTQVIKGAVNDQTPEAEYKVDGLSGATITSNGVTSMVRYWLGPNGYGPFLKKRVSASEGGV